MTPGTGAPGEDHDILLARAYRHPAIADRVVVRLVPAVLAEAEDLTAEYLGFAAPIESTEVGTVRRVALGFPAWALVNDPGNAHHALALVKEIERLDRVAKSKAGAAKDGFTELATMLGRSAPHFLPTFYEEAARIFLKHGNTTYASTMFGKAREAEQVHDLAVDPERVRAVFLEFAFAGALPAKALSAYAKGLASRHDAADAFDRFRTLCLERVRAGLPPHAGMPEDLRRLAKAAKLDVRAEDERVLREVLGTSSIARAAAGFWKSYRDPLVSLAQNDPEIRARLLAFVPQQTSTLDLWLDILTAGGATQALTGPADPAVSITPAAWLTSVVATRSVGWRDAPRSAALLTLVEKMAARLAAGGERVRLSGRWYESELDLIDLLLAHGIPVESDATEADVWEWLVDETPGRRDLSAYAASEHGAVLGAGVVDCLRNNSDEDDVATSQLVREILGVPGLRIALRDWITKNTEAIGLTVPSLTQTLTEFAALRVPEVFTDVPDAVGALAGVDIPEALRRTLRAGLLDELGWPAVEEAAAKFTDSVALSGEGWPALVLGRGDSFVVAGPDGLLAEHIAKIPAAARHQWYHDTTAAWFDGVLLVSWSGPNRRLAYWSDNPGHHIAPGATDPFDSYDVHASVALPGGGRFTGGRTVHVGDTVIPLPRPAYSDGTTVWATAQWLEVDPLTGKAGRESLPAFLDGVEGLERQYCDLRPIAPGTEASPLGAKNGLHGWRVHKDANGTWVGEGIDGRRVQADVPVSGLLDLPGARLAVSEQDDGFALLDADGTTVATLDYADNHPTYAAGTPVVMPLRWWHLLRPRDEAGSAALREVSREAAEAMLAVAVAEVDRSDWDGDLDEYDIDDSHARYTDLVNGKRDALATAVLGALPEISHPGLLAGVLSVVRQAARLVVAHRPFTTITLPAGEREQDQTGPDVTENQVSVALDWLGRHRNESAGPARTGLPALTAALREIASRPEQAAEDLPECRTYFWGDLMPYVGAIAMRAASPITPAEHRDTLALVLRWIADSGMLDQPGQWRRVVATVPEDQTAQRHRVHPTPGGFIAVAYTSWYGPGGDATGVQFTRTPDEFALPDGWELKTADPVSALDSAWINRFLDVLAERGPYLWRPESVAALVERTGLGSAESAYMLAGMPMAFRASNGFISAEERAVLGLSQPGAKAARERMRDLRERLRQQLLAAAAPAEPGDLWTTGPNAAAVAEVWTAEFGAVTPVDDDVLADATKRFPSMRGVAGVVTALLNPASTKWLNTDADYRLVDGHLEERVKDGFTDSTLFGIAHLLLWLAQRLPGDSPHREALARSLELARERVAHPGFGLSLGGWFDADEVRTLTGAEPSTEVGHIPARDWLDVHFDGEDYSFTAWPGRIGPHDRDLVAAVAELVHSRDFEVLDLLAAAGTTAACTAPPVNGYYQDASISVPDLVAEVAAHHDLHPDAAVLYLQLLALPDPTDANVARWTGWKPARLRAARTALAETDLVLTAKRARAGRSLFLPGGWLALASPHLPLEAWKAPLYNLPEHPWLVITPLEPVPDLFTRAWTRTRTGDAPAYDRLDTARRR
ncbi:hypothetical protein [Actinokineospora baliensis]|uniref:hypothetical protein n=1 Tax=Actinokineospora baliensis TaxID=547056 RepID=UPI0035583D4E